MRKYQRVWERLKKGETVALAVPPDNQRLVISGVRREKNKDYEFKFVCSEAHKKFRVMCNKSGTTLTFYLQYTKYNLYI